MAKQTFRIEGLKELEKAMMDLPKRVNKRVAAKVLMETAKPLAADGSALAPDDPETGGFDLHTTVRAGTRNTKGAGWTKKDPVEVFIGPRVRHAHLLEFGTKDMDAQPYMRPMWDGGKDWALRNIATLMGEEVAKAAARYARRVARGRR
jgi:HK97 gp10 family phage protein